MQIASICLSSVTNQAHMTKVIGGDVNNVDTNGNHRCTSFGGSMRRFRSGVVLRLPGQPADIEYRGALLHATADYPAAGQLCGTMESTRSTFINLFNFISIILKYLCSQCHPLLPTLLLHPSKPCRPGQLSQRQLYHNNNIYYIIYYNNHIRVI